MAEYPGVTFEAIFGAPGSSRVYRDGVLIGTIHQFKRRFVAVDAGDERLGASNSEARAVARLIARADG